MTLNCVSVNVPSEQTSLTISEPSPLTPHSGSQGLHSFKLTSSLVGAIGCKRTLPSWMQEDSNLLDARGSAEKRMLGPLSLVEGCPSSIYIIVNIPGFKHSSFHPTYSCLTTQGLEVRPGNKYHLAAFIFSSLTLGLLSWANLDAVSPLVVIHFPALQEVPEFQVNWRDVALVSYFLVKVNV